MKKVSKLWKYLESISREGITIREFADDIGLDKYESVRRYAKGEHYPSFEMCYLIAKTYKADAEEVFLNVQSIRRGVKENEPSNKCDVQ